MKGLKALHWIAALALLLGQWGMFVHAGEHGLEEADDTLCVVCVQGHNLQKLQVSHTPVVFFDHNVLSPTETTHAAIPAAPADRSTIRAPPHCVHN